MVHKDTKKILSNKKGQAAMEFLMTYGWAILIVLVAIAALYFMGVFSPPISEKCLPQLPFASCGFKMTASNVNQFSATWPKSAVDGNPQLLEVNLEGGGTCGVLAVPISLTVPGQAETFSCPGAGSPGLVPGDGFKATAILVYTRQSISHRVNIDISGTVEA